MHLIDVGLLFRPSLSDYFYASQSFASLTRKLAATRMFTNVGPRPLFIHPQLVSFSSKNCYYFYYVYQALAVQLVYPASLCFSISNLPQAQAPHRELSCRGRQKWPRVKKMDKSSHSFHHESILRYFFLDLRTRCFFLIHILQIWR